MEDVYAVAFLAMIMLFATATRVEALVVEWQRRATQQAVSVEAIRTLGVVAPSVIQLAENVLVRKAGGDRPENAGVNRRNQENGANNGERAV